MLSARYLMTDSLASFLVPACFGALLLSCSAADAQLQLNRPMPQVKKQSPASAPAAVKPQTKTLAPRPLEESGIVVNRLQLLDPDANGLFSH